MKNIDYINKVVSKKLDIDEKVVKKVNSFYWNSAIKGMHSLENPSVFLRGLGTFYLPYRRTKKEILRLIGFLKWGKDNVENWEESPKKLRMEEKVAKLWKLKKELEGIYEKKKINRQNKKRSE